MSARNTEVDVSGQTLRSAPTVFVIGNWGGYVIIGRIPPAPPPSSPSPLPVHRRPNPYPYPSRTAFAVLSRSALRDVSTYVERCSNLCEEISQPTLSDVATLVERCADVRRREYSFDTGANQGMPYHGGKGALCRTNTEFITPWIKIFAIPTKGSVREEGKDIGEGDSGHQALSAGLLPPLPSPKSVLSSFYIW